MARASQPSTAELKREFDTLRADFAALTRELKSFAQAQEKTLSARASDSAAAAAEGLRETVREAASGARDAGAHHLDTIRQLAEQAGAGAEDMVRERPAATIAGAAALGFLVGALTAARR